MCGRYTVIQNVPDALAAAFDLPAPPDLPGLAPRYNVAPTQLVPVVRQGGGIASPNVGQLGRGA